MGNVRAHTITENRASEYISWEVLTGGNPRRTNGNP